MDKVLNKMEVLANAISGIKSELKTENQSLKNELKNEIKVVYWVIGIAATIMGYLLYRK